MKTRRQWFSSLGLGLVLIAVGCTKSWHIPDPPAWLNEMPPKPEWWSSGMADPSGSLKPDGYEQIKVFQDRIADMVRNGVNVSVNDNVMFLSSTLGSRRRVALSLEQPSGVWPNGFGWDLAGRLTNVTSPAGAYGKGLAGGWPATKSHAHRSSFSPGAAFAFFALLCRLFGSVTALPLGGTPGRARVYRWEGGHSAV